MTTIPPATAATPRMQDIPEIQSRVAQGIRMSGVSGLLVDKAEYQAFLKHRAEQKAIKAMASAEAKAARKVERARRKIVAALTQADPA